MTRQYYAWAGGTPDDHAALARMSAAGPADMGPLLASFRGGVGARALGRSLALLALVCVGLGAMVAGLAPGGPSLALVVGAWCVAAAVYLPAMLGVHLAARRTRQDVHRHGLVVRGPGSRAEALPWESMDPGRIFIATSVRAMTRMPLALHRQQAVLPPGVVVNAWTDRPLGSLPVAEALSQGYRYQPAPTDSPFGWWQLGPSDPRAFLQAVEAAMVADGYPAAGLTPFVLARRVRAGDLRRAPELQRERALVDPVVGLPQG